MHRHCLVSRRRGWVFDKSFASLIIRRLIVTLMHSSRPLVELNLHWSTGWHESTKEQNRLHSLTVSENMRPFDPLQRIAVPDFLPNIFRWHYEFVEQSKVLLAANLAFWLPLRHSSWVCHQKIEIGRENNLVLAQFSKPGFESWHIFVSLVASLQACYPRVVELISLLP